MDCTHASHAAKRESLEAFMRGTDGFFYEWDGALYADCADGCKSTIAFDLEGDE